MRIEVATLVGLLVTAAACGQDPAAGATEVISRVELSFSPVAGGAEQTFSFSDPDGDGGASGTAERITLAPSTEYALAIAFVDDLVDPPEDVTEEIREEAEDHLVFVLGDAVSGPASASPSAFVEHAYADVESDYTDDSKGGDLPVGLANTLVTDAPGMGTLRVVLRHLPDLNETPQKAADLPERLAAGEELPGDVDVDVSFPLLVQ